MEKKYKSQAARDAQRLVYGNTMYWEYLEDSALELHKYYKEIGDNKKTEEMLTRTLQDALRGNERN